MITMTYGGITISVAPSDKQFYMLLGYVPVVEKSGEAASVPPTAAPTVELPKMGSELESVLPEKGRKKK